ncbi:MAG: DNA recombination protein RmuC [bacterium]
MEIGVLIAIISMFVIILAAFWWFNQKLESLKKPDDEKGFSLLNQNIQGMQERLDKTTEVINERLDNAARVVSAVQKELGSMSEIGRQLSDFQHFLRSPKMRGNLGEQILKDLLEQVLPRDTFSMQYKFRSGDVVDAIIKTNDRLYPIDSKFPLENFNKINKTQDEKDKKHLATEFVNDVRKHIRTVSDKYILPEEGTVDFAVMYIPSESLYYEVITRYNDEINSYAIERKVFLVSPNSFFYFLRTVMLGMEGQKLQENSQKILQLLQTLQKDNKIFGTGLSVLDRHVTNAKNSMEKVSTGYIKLSGKIENIKTLESDSVEKLHTIKNQGSEILEESFEAKEDIKKVKTYE